MNPTAFDRLVSLLPPERRAAAAVSLVGMSDDPNGPIATLYAEIFERLERAKREQRADQEGREKLFRCQLEKLRESNQTTIRAEVDRLHQGKFWPRMLFSRMATILAGLTLVAVAMPFAIRHVLAAQQQGLQSAMAESAALLQQYLKDNQAESARLAEAQRREIDEIRNQLTAYAGRLSFGDAIRHVFNGVPQIKSTIGPEVFTLRIQDNLTRKEQGMRVIEIKHGLTPVEFDNLKQTVEASKAISIPR